MAKPTEYLLQINEPGAMLNDKEYIALLRSSTPFLSITKGDLIHSFAANTTAVPHGHVLRVTCVEHLIQDLDTHYVHYLYVNTELAVDSADSRR